MSNYNWCHGPNCHTKETQSRVRGSGDNKVLRTIKIKHDSNYRSHERYYMFNYFCNQNCLMQFLKKFRQEVANIRPVKQPTETPIKVEVKTYDAPDHSYYDGKKYKTIEVLNK